MIVDDSIYVYINGKYVGNSHPFWTVNRVDITRFFKQGQNRLTGQVYSGTQNAGMGDGHFNCPIKRDRMDTGAALLAPWLAG